MQINNLFDLHTNINEKIKQAMDLTMDELLEKLKDYIQQDVYDNSTYGQPQPQWYTRSYELLNNWDYTKAEIIGNNSIESILSFSKPITHSDYPLYQHGVDQVNNQEFADIVNSGKIGDLFGFPQLGARPYWDDFWKYAELNVHRIFAEKCNLVGLPISPTLSYM